MDHDVYLILIGAGISLVSGIVTLILQFLLSQWSESLRIKHEEKKRQSQEIRAALLDKSKPVHVPGSLMKRLLPDGDPGDIDLDIPSFLRRKKAGGGSEPIIPITPRQFWLAVFIGILVFVIWVGAVIIR